MDTVVKSMLEEEEEEPKVIYLILSMLCKQKDLPTCSSFCTWSGILFPVHKPILSPKIKFGGFILIHKKFYEQK